MTGFITTHKKQHGCPGHEVDGEASSPEWKMGLFDLQDKFIYIIGTEYRWTKSEPSTTKTLVS